MGWCVISFVTIEFRNKIIRKERIAQIKAIMKKQGVSFYNFEKSPYCITFELSGNKTIDYGFMEIIKTEFKDKIAQITASEYAETGEGYLFDNYDYEELKE